MAAPAVDDLNVHNEHVKVTAECRPPELPFASPTTWTAHTIDPGSCQCFTDSPIEVDLAKVDALVAQAFHNLRCSPLCRLPEECLLEIMECLDPLSIQCLRRTCRLFLRLYCSPTFSEGHDIEWYNKNDSIYWYEPKLEYWSDKNRLQPLLDRDIREYCADCRGMRMGKTWNKKVAQLTTEYMHCSGCSLDHPVGLFSAAQRQVPSKERICIGREGFVKFCGHKAVTWDQVAPIALGLSKLDTGNKDNNAEVFLAECEDQSHFPEHHDGESPQLLDQQICPCAFIVGNREDKVAVVLRWVGHLRLPDLGYGEFGQNRNASPSLIRQQLDQFRQGAAEFIAPNFPPGRLTEMNCFDPNRCCCLHYAGAERLPRGWQLISPQELRFSNCRVDPERRLGPLRPMRNDGRDMDREERTCSHYVSVPTMGTSDHGSSTVDVWITSCPGQSRCLQVRYCRDITIVPRRGCRSGRVTTAWYQALDPDSYNLTDDTESFGVLWCRKQGCRNYYRYLKRVLVPFEDTHRDCGISCPP